MKHNPLELQLKTLSPLWTGGINKMDRIHESSIIGSLRWWYEAIVRGLGGDVCNPTSDNSSERCPRSEEQQKKGKQEYCDVCQLFGATGWRRRFRLHVDAVNCKPIWPTDTTHTRSRGLQHEWHLPPGLVGTLRLHIIGDAATVGNIATLLLFLEQWGGIGAKQPHGYGRFAIANRNEAETCAVSLSFPMQQSQPQREWINTPLPNLQDFLFYQIQFQPRESHWWQLLKDVRTLGNQKRVLEEYVEREQGMIPISPMMRYALRSGQPWPSREVNAWLFGIALIRHRLQSKVCIGWAYQERDSWCIPGWVWLPRDRQVRRDYASIKQHIQQLLQERSVWLQPLGLQGKVRSMHMVIKTGVEIAKELGMAKGVLL